MDAKRRWRSRHARIISVQRAVRERYSRLGFAEAGHNGTVRSEEECLIRTHQVGDGAVRDCDGCAAIARHAVSPRQAADGIGDPAAVFIKGGVEGAVAVEGEQTGERIRSTAGSAAAKSESRHVNHHAAIQRSIGETSRGSLLPQHDAIQQGGGSRYRVTPHRKELSRVHNIKCIIQTERRTPDRESKVECAAPRGGIGHGVIRRRKGH